jgi:GT2 family glycosyltransferase
LHALQLQTVYPDQIIIVDASLDRDSEAAVCREEFKNLQYFFVDDVHRGLTKQRNYGISKVGATINFICFFDDDIVPEPDYFERLMGTYLDFPEALGVGGYIIDDTKWQFAGKINPDNSMFSFDGWQRQDSSRFVLRKRIGLDSNQAPGFSTGFSHGRSVGFLPPSGKTYEVEQFMGGVSSFRKRVFEDFQFSTYFEGYGLYEDADFCLRLVKSGKLYLNTAARVYHHHAGSGRPNQYKYGKMVVRNGYYVWRVKNPKPSLQEKFKWHAITILLTLIRFSNVIGTSDRKRALTESLGRTAGWLGILFNPPKPDPAGKLR